MAILTKLIYCFLLLDSSSTIWSVKATSITLNNNVGTSATIEDATGLFALSGSGKFADYSDLKISGDSWSVAVNVTSLNIAIQLSPNIPQCKYGGMSRADSQHADLTWDCTVTQIQQQLPLVLTVTAAFELKNDTTFVSKTLQIHSSRTWSQNSGGTFNVANVSPWGQNMLITSGSTIKDFKTAGSTLLPDNPFNKGNKLALFARWGGDSATGFFLATTNPWATYNVTISQSTGFLVQSLTADSVTHFASTIFGHDFASEPAVIGLTKLSAVETSDGINTGEMRDFKKCVESFLLDGSQRSKGPIKVNVAWDESDYQIDVGTETGRNEYKRIIDRNAELGVTHVVYEPRNTLHANRHNSTDGWGWEASLWFSMGERLREGNWQPQSDPVPEDILNMVQYAGQKGVKLMAYVYPCLAFEAQSQAVINGALDLSAKGVAEWMVNTMTAFVKSTGAGGFAWDHNIFAGDVSLRYAQWRAWTAILTNLRLQFPDLTMDHRQTAHIYGPWYALAGSYSEPIAGDENPESFGVPVPTLHTDHVSADQTRRINWIYSMQQLLPVQRIPGFMFHQTERTADNGDTPCFGNSDICYDNNTRDFDLLGYKYSVISNIATAPLNQVLCMIPARDVDEFNLFPSPDVQFIQNWIIFAQKYHENVLSNIVPITSLPEPATGGVDGTAAFSEDAKLGFIFLFNPEMVSQCANFMVDESIHIPNVTTNHLNSGALSWTVAEIYPRNFSVGVWTHGQNVSVQVSAGSARVLKLTKFNATHPEKHGEVFLTGIEGEGSTKLRSDNQMAITLSNVIGKSGTTETAAIWTNNFTRSEGLNGGVSVNGIACSRNKNTSILQSPIGTGDMNGLKVDIDFAGDIVQKLMSLGELPSSSNIGGTFIFKFVIPGAVQNQLKQRQSYYPIDWYPAEYNATWLVPTRLLASIYTSKPSTSWNINATIDGIHVKASQAFNSRGLVRPNVFLGWYLDLDTIFSQSSDFGKNHTLKLTLPTIQSGQFKGVFLENVETEYSRDVVACREV